MTRLLLHRAVVAEWLRRLSEGLFYLLLAFTPFAWGTVEPWSLSLAHLMVYGVVTLYLTGTMLSGKREYILPLPLVLLAIFFAWSLIATAFFSVYRYSSLVSLLKLTDYLLVLFYVANRFRRQERQLRLGFAIAIIGVAVAAYGLIQYFASPGGLLPEFVGSAIGATAPYINHNHYAGYLELALAVTVGLFAATRGKVRLEVTVMLGAIALLMLLGLLFSLSRGGVLSALAVGLVFALIFIVRSQARLTYSPVIILAVIALGYLWVLETERIEARLETLGDSATLLTFNGRTLAWKAAWRAVENEPLVGYGPGTFATVLPRYREPGFQPRFYYAHNDYLQAWVEHGALGLAVIVAALVAFLAGLWKLLAASDLKRHYLACGAGAGLTSLLVHTFFDFNLNLHANALLFIVLAALFGLSQPQQGLAAFKLKARLVGVVLPTLLLVMAGGLISVRVLQAERFTREADVVVEGSPLSAAALYLAAIEQTPWDADLSLKAGGAYVEAARQTGSPFFYQRAKGLLERSGELKPGSSESWIAQAFLMAETGRQAQAEELFKRALECDPANPACYFYLSNFYLATTDTVQAIEHSRRGIGLAPGFFGDRLNRLWQFVQAPALLNRLVPESFNAGHYLLAVHYYRHKLYRESLAELALCDGQTRWERPCFNLTGQNYLGLELADSAEGCFRLGVATKPEEPSNYRTLAALLGQRGLHREAEELFSKALGSVNIHRKGLLRYEYALYLGRIKDYPRQRDQLEKALREDMNNQGYLELLADSYLAEERFYEAMKELHRIEVLAPGRVSALRKLAQVYGQLGNKERAREYCGKVIAVAPQDGFATRLLAELVPKDAARREGSDGI